MERLYAAQAIARSCLEIGMTLNEIERGDGTIEVEIGDRKPTRAVCGHQQFDERSAMLNARRATFFKVDWANKEARERASVYDNPVSQALPEKCRVR